MKPGNNISKLNQPEFRMRWTIGKKIGCLAALLLILQIPAVIVSQYGLRRLNYEVRDMATYDVPVLQMINDLKGDEYQTQLAFARSLHDGQERTDARGDFEYLRLDIDQDIQDLRDIAHEAMLATSAVTEEEAADSLKEFGALLTDLEAFQIAHERWISRARTAMELEASMADRFDMFDRETAEHDAVQARLADMSALATSFSSDGIEQSNEVANQAMMSQILIAGGSAAIGLVSSLLIVRRLSRSVHGLSTSASAIAGSLTQGTFKPVRVAITSSDEIGQLAEAINEIVHSLDQSIGDYKRAAVAQEMAEAATRIKSEFLANMSHEIRTPMTAILGYAELMQDEELSLSDRKQYIQTIRRNGEHLLSVINDILDISKIEAGGMVVDRSSTSPCQVVAEVAALMRVRAAGKNIPLNVEYIFPVPERIQSDTLRLRQILMNLVGNAIKFTEKGGVRIIVRSHTHDLKKPQIAFEIADSGIGMTPQQKEQLFKPFSQVDSSATRRFGGTGLGLTISRRLAHLLGGEITVVSAPGQGSTFTLTIETGSLEGVRMIENAHEAIAEPTPNEQPETIMVRGRILLAEDGPDNQRLIAFLLRKAGGDVQIVENGRLAIEAIMSANAIGKPFDVILMDMAMPVLDGYEAAAELRHLGVLSPIIALTAHAMSGDREKCINAGCDDYVAKPVNRTILLSTVRRYLNNDAGIVDRATGMAAR